MSSPPRSRLRVRLLAGLTTATLALSALGHAEAQQSPAVPAREVLAWPVRFDVVNRNTSDLPCPADGLPYSVRGHLVGPRTTLSADATDRLVTILLTGNDESEWTWRFQEVPGYDYTLEMARLGHTSLSIDMVGYGTSGKPLGHLVCLGSQADVNHQITQQLRAGTYEVLAAADAVRFEQVLVSGHDIGAIPALVQAYTWGDIDGISAQIWAHQGAKPEILELFARRVADCARGGMSPDDPPDDPDDPLDDPSRGGGYVLFGPRNDEFRAVLFNHDRTDPAAIDAVVGLRNRNPCGIYPSVSTSIRVDLTRMGEIDVPVLLVYPGPGDPVISREGQEAEAAHFRGTDDVTTVWLDSGHWMTLDDCAPDYRALTARWIRARWGVGDGVAAPAIGGDQCVTDMRVK